MWQFIISRYYHYQDKLLHNTLTNITGYCISENHNGNFSFSQQVYASPLFSLIYWSHRNEQPSVPIRTMKWNMKEGCRGIFSVSLLQFLIQYDLFRNSTALQLGWSSNQKSPGIFWHLLVTFTSNKLILQCIALSLWLSYHCLLHFFCRRID